MLSDCAVSAPQKHPLTTEKQILKNFLTKRGYKDNFVKEQIRRAKRIYRNEALQEVQHTPDDTKKTNRVPFIITHNPALPNIHKILHGKQPIFHSSERLSEIFKETPVVAYRRSPNLRVLLVRAKLKTPNTTLNTTPGTFRCESKHGCLTCPHIDHGRTTYTFTNTGEVRQIKQHITCKSTNLTYMIECLRCKNQYIGETKRMLRERFKEHRQATNNPNYSNATAAVPTHLYKEKELYLQMALTDEINVSYLKFYSISLTNISCTVIYTM